VAVVGIVFAALNVRKPAFELSDVVRYDHLS
jgi:xanthosine utilization system XapX-like protein